MKFIKVFNFSDKIPSFSKTIELCLTFCMGFCITLLVLPNYKESQSIKPYFILTTRATLRYLSDISIKSSIARKICFVVPNLFMYRVICTDHAFLTLMQTHMSSDVSLLRFKYLTKQKNCK